MAFSEEDKNVIKFLRQNKHQGAKRFLKEFPHKSWSRGGLDKIIRKIDRTGTSNRHTRLSPENLRAGSSAYIPNAAPLSSSVLKSRYISLQNE